MKWFEKTHLREREGKKKDLVASNPHHTYFSDQRNTNYKLSNGKINVNPGGLDHESQNWILTERLAGWQPAQEEGGERKREAKALGKNGDEHFSMVLTYRTLGRRGRGAALRPLGPTVVLLFLPTHLEITYSYKQWWLLMPTTHYLGECPMKCLIGRGATFTGISLQSFQRFLQTSQFLVNRPLDF